MTERFVFIGEERSQTAIDRNWTWRDGRLSAKQLFDALHEVGIDPEQQAFINLFEGDKIPEGYKVVGMGRKVQQKLSELGIEHIKIVHPAARGTIRRKENYTRHIKERLVEA